MCRHLAYLGPPVALGSLLFDAPHALVHQARTPKHQHAGRDNPDGWGVAWAGPEYDHYRSALPIWEDTAFRGTERASSILAAARYASTGSLPDVRNSAPFVSGPYAFSLNGYVAGFRDGLGDELRARVSTARARALEGDTDSEVLFALVLDQLDAGASPGEALVAVTRLVRADSPGALNLMLVDGTTVAATALDNSLFVRRSPGMLVASEPLDDHDSWIEVDNGSLVENDRVTPIGGLP
jgi:gamma-glutamyl hercynylcysteine S-oxide hydrolase